MAMSTVGLPDGINTTLLTIAVIIIITIIITINIYNLDHGPNINTMLNIIIIILSNRISTSIFAAERVQMPKAPSFQKKIPNTSHPRPLKKPNARLAPEHGIGVHIEVIPSLPWLGTRGLNPQICPLNPTVSPETHPRSALWIFTSPLSWFSSMSASYGQPLHLD